jgi:hypothetical protein
MSELFSKALSNIDSLTDTEIRILATGAHLPPQDEILYEQKKLVDKSDCPRTQLMWQAITAIATPEKNRVKAAALKKYRKLPSAPDEMRLWIKTLKMQIDRGDIKRWGLVLSHTVYEDERTQATFSTKLHQDAASMIRTVGAAAILDQFELVEIRDHVLEGANIRQLRERFSLVKHHLTTGICREFFLTVDEANEQTALLRLWAANPSPATSCAEGSADEASCRVTIFELISYKYGNIVLGYDPLIVYDGNS